MRIFPILLLVLLLVGWHIVCESVRELHGRRSLEAFAGTKLPDDVKLFYQEDSWNGFLPDGHFVDGYVIGGDAEWINEKRCDRNGFSKVKRAGVTIPVPDKYITIDNNLPVCHKYKLTKKGRETEIVFIRGGLVIHYWERI